MTCLGTNGFFYSEFFSKRLVDDKCHVLVSRHALGKASALLDFNAVHIQVFIVYIDIRRRDIKYARVAFYLESRLMKVFTQSLTAGGYAAYQGVTFQLGPKHFEFLIGLSIHVNEHHLILVETKVLVFHERQLLHNDEGANNHGQR